MKTLNTILTISFLALSSPLLASTDDYKPAKNSNVPTAPNVWSSPDIEAPVSLKYLKAKYALVPIVEFVWGTPSDVPASLVMVPLAPFVFGSSTDTGPLELAGIKVKSLDVPVSPFILGEPEDVPSFLILK